MPKTFGLRAAALAGLIAVTGGFASPVAAYDAPTGVVFADNPQPGGSTCCP